MLYQRCAVPTTKSPSVPLLLLSAQADWLLAQTFMGITTFYKMDPNGSVWIKMHGTMDGVGVMDQLATIREVDLFNKWVPFCKTSKLLKRLGDVELLAYFSVSMPGVGR